jgi:hypothetical protein
MIYIFLIQRQTHTSGVFRHVPYVCSCENENFIFYANKGRGTAEMSSSFSSAPVTDSSAVLYDPMSRPILSARPRTRIVELAWNCDGINHGASMCGQARQSDTAVAISHKSLIPLHGLTSNTTTQIIEST